MQMHLHSLNLTSLPPQGDGGASEPPASTSSKVAILARPRATPSRTLSISCWEEARRPRASCPTSCCAARTILFEGTPPSASPRSLMMCGPRATTCSGRIPVALTRRTRRCNPSCRRSSPCRGAAPARRRGGGCRTRGANAGRDGQGRRSDQALSRPSRLDFKGRVQCGRALFRGRVGIPGHS